MNGFHFATVVETPKEPSGGSLHPSPSISTASGNERKICANKEPAALVIRCGFAPFPFYKQHLTIKIRTGYPRLITLPVYFLSLTFSFNASKQGEFST
jgi:hypothetical protein